MYVKERLQDYLHISHMTGTMSPRRWIYPLSIAEQHVIKEYMAEALKQGYIEPSLSPASTGVFLIDKRGGD